MTAKKYLRMVWELQKRISQLEGRLSRRSASDAGLISSYGAESVSHSRRTDSLQLAAEMHMLYEQELEQKRLELNAAKGESTQWIENIADPDLRTVLRLRYVDLRKWEDIAMIMCMSERWVYLKHGEALRMFETVNARQLAQRPP